MLSAFSLSLPSSTCSLFRSVRLSHCHCPFYQHLYFCCCHCCSIAWWWSVQGRTQGQLDKAEGEPNHWTFLTGNTVATLPMTRLITLAASSSVYTTAFRLERAVIHAVLRRLLQSLVLQQIVSSSLSHMAVHGLAKQQSSFCSHSSSKECISYALFSSPVPSFGSSCVCLSTTNTPPQSHARTDHNDDLDPFSTSKVSFVPKDSFGCDGAC